MASPSGDSSRAAKDESINDLSSVQVGRVMELVSQRVKIPCMKGKYPTLIVSPLEILKAVRNNLAKMSVPVHRVMLMGSGASYCLAEERKSRPVPHYNDVDISLFVNLQIEKDHYYITDEVLYSLADFFPGGPRQYRINNSSLADAYVKKLVKIWSDTDRWSLISLGGECGMDIELKFVHHVRRDYQFSVDSFGITLDPILSMPDATASESLMQVRPDLLPRVHATCLYGSFSDAFRHLNNRLICTRDPEKIRGGGLLKYCYLRAIGYMPDSTIAVERLELRMSVQFFTDFPAPRVQEKTITRYILTHFPTRENLQEAFDFLKYLSDIVSQCCAGRHRERSTRLVEQIRDDLTKASRPLSPPPPPSTAAPSLPPSSDDSLAAPSLPPSSDDSLSRRGNPSAAPPQTPPRNDPPGPSASSSSPPRVSADVYLSR